VAVVGSQLFNTSRTLSTSQKRSDENVLYMLQPQQVEFPADVL